MVVRPKVKANPELISAVIIRSRDSFTAVSGDPTITMELSPNPAFTSTSTPLTVAEQTFEVIDQSAMSFFGWQRHARQSDLFAGGTNHFTFLENKLGMARTSLNSIPNLQCWTT
jgi:hypothetical protein